LLEDDDEGLVERLGGPDGEVKGPLDGGDGVPEACVLLNLGLHEDDEEGWADRLGDVDSEVEGPVEG